MFFLSRHAPVSLTANCVATAYFTVFAEKFSDRYLG